jgi:hypothetical protein
MRQAVGRTGLRTVCLSDEDDRALAFHFHPGDPVYRKLVSTPGLRARIAVDTAGATGREILSVTFQGK